MDESKALHEDEIEDILQQMEAAIRKLPILPDKEPFVPEAAALVATSAYFCMDALPPRGDAAAIRELDKLAKHLAATIDCLNNFPEEAFQALRDEPDGLEADLEFGDEIMALTLFRRRALLAKARLEAKPVKKGGGRRPDYKAADVAERALGCFEALTSKPAGVSTNPWTSERGGPYLRFLTDVFNVLGMKASPEAQAKRAVQKRSMGGHAFTTLLCLWKWIKETH
jgi:hypothetical protein